jgi:hypothetical protein
MEAGTSRARPATFTQAISSTSETAASRIASKPEALRQDADDGVRTPVQADGGPEDGGIRPEMRLPDAV